MHTMSLMKPRVIIFIGNVGSGKTTQMSILANYLKSKGLNPKIAYLKTIFLVTRKFLPIFNAVITDALKLKKIHRILVTIDLVLNIFILPIVSLLRVHLPTRFNKIVLVEEHLPGSIVDYVHASMTLKVNWDFVKNLIRVLFKSLYIHNSSLMSVELLCDPSILIAHWRERGSFGEHPTYLKVQQVVFKAWAKTMPTVTIDTNTSIDITAMRIKTLIDRWLASS